MNDVFLVKKGIDPTIYYRHTCGTCESEFDIVNTVKQFKCSHCNSEEICAQSPESQIKRYLKPTDLSKQPSKKTLFKK